MAVTEVQLEAYNWTVQRTGILKEVHQENGSITYLVEVRDGDRPPFIKIWFNDLTPASDFLDWVKAGKDPKAHRAEYRRKMSQGGS